MRGGGPLSPPGAHGRPCAGDPALRPLGLRPHTPQRTTSGTTALATPHLFIMQPMAGDSCGARWSPDLTLSFQHPTMLWRPRAPRPQALTPRHRPPCSHLPSAQSDPNGLWPAYPGVGDRAPQLLQVPDEAAVCLHVGVLDQLGQVLLTHTWRRRTGGLLGMGPSCGGLAQRGQGDKRWPRGSWVKGFEGGERRSLDCDGGVLRRGY